MILHKPIAASDMDKKALKLSPLLWSSFDSLCSAGEVVDPSSIWDRDAEALDTLDYCTGANPVMNLINCSASTPAPPPVFVPTPRPAARKSGPRVELSLKIEQTVHGAEAKLPIAPRCRSTIGENHGPRSPKCRKR